MTEERLQQLEGYAARMRGMPTNGECRFRHRLAKYARQNDFTFKCQQVFCQWIFDFYLETIGVLIEVDGPIHLGAAQRKKDAAKQKAAERRGFIVIHIKNEGVGAFDFDSIPISLKRGRKTKAKLEKMMRCKPSKSNKVRQDSIIPVGERKVKVIKHVVDK